jgi:hypothetical protein
MKKIGIRRFPFTIRGFHISPILSNHSTLGPSQYQETPARLKALSHLIFVLFLALKTKSVLFVLTLILKKNLDSVLIFLNMILEFYFPSSKKLQTYFPKAACGFIYHFIILALCKVIF